MSQKSKLFTKYLKENNFPYEKTKIFEKYDAFLQNYNQKINLVSKNSAQNMWVKHFLDSIIPMEFENFKEKKVLDLGSGAGFPSVPIRILEPSVKLILVESTMKKCVYLNSLLSELNIKNAQVINERFENISIKDIGEVDLILVRAVKMRKKYFKESFSLLKKDGELILYKSGIDEKEIALLKSIKTKYEMKKINRNIAEIGNRNYIIIKKL